MGADLKLTMVDDEGHETMWTIKQKNFKEQGHKFVEEESRAQRLIDFYCEMCERAEQSGISSRQKLNMQKEGQSLMDELAKQDKITSDEVEMILEDCQLNHGPEFKSYDMIANILNKILNDVNLLHKQRE